MTTRPILPILFALAAGCATTTLTTKHLTGRPLFCAHGGIGVTPVPEPPDIEDHFAIMVIEVDNPGSVMRGVAVTDMKLLDAGGVLQPMRRLHEIEILPVVLPPSSPEANGAYAFYLNSVPAAVPFGGTLPHGRNWLRVRASFWAPVSPPAQCRVTMDGLTIDARSEGEWPQ